MTRADIEPAYYPIRQSLKAAAGQPEGLSASIRETAIRSVMTEFLLHMAIES